MLRLCGLVLVSVVAVGCAPTLYFTRPTAPEGSFGNVRTMSVTVRTDVPNAVGSAVGNALVLGEVPLPIPADGVVKQRFESALAQLGYQVCPAAPCGDGAMNIVLTQSEIGSEFTSGGFQFHSRLTVRVVLRQNDGQEPYDFTFWDRRSGSIQQGPSLVEQCADALAQRMARTLMPGKQRGEMTLVDGGPLSQGVNLLLSSNWSGAESYFAGLTQQQPDLHGAWYDLGVAYEMQARWGEALGAYQKAAELKRSAMYLDAVAQAQSMAPRAAPASQQLQTVPQIIPAQ